MVNGFASVAVTPTMDADFRLKSGLRERRPPDIATFIERLPAKMENDLRRPRPRRRGTANCRSNSN